MFFSRPTTLLSTNVYFTFTSDEDYSSIRVSNEDYKSVLIYIMNMRWLPELDSYGSVTIENGIMTIDGLYNTFGYSYQRFTRKYIVGEYGQCIMSEVNDGFTFENEEGI
jgi:hypothetical protein